MILKRTRQLDIYIAIKELHEEHPDYSVLQLCRIGNVTRGAYYKWKNRLDSPNDALNRRVAENAIKYMMSIRTWDTDASVIPWNMITVSM